MAVRHRNCLGEREAKQQRHDYGLTAAGRSGSAVPSASPAGVSDETAAQNALRPPLRSRAGRLALDNVSAVTDAQTPSTPSWRYQFTATDGSEIATDSFADDEAAETWARERSQADNIAITIRRHSAHVDAWEYVTEVDERSAI